MEPTGFRAGAAAPVPLPLAASGRWIVASATGITGPGRVAVFVDFLDAAGRSTGGRVYLRPRGGGRWRAVCFVPEATTAARLGTFGCLTPHARPEIAGFRPIGAAEATARLIGRSPRALSGLFRGGRASNPAGLKERVREALAALVAGNGKPHTYRDWIALFDECWTADGLAKASNPPLAFLVFHRGAEAPLSATLASLRAQFVACPSAVVVAGAAGAPPWRAALDSLAGVSADGYVGLLQAGEVLPAHAAALASSCLATLGLPDLAYADEDALSPKDEREAPLFKPEPNHALMLSGTLSRGLWLVRHDVLIGQEDLDAGWAETLRLDLWLRRYEAAGVSASGQALGRRIPFVLSHRRPDAESAPPEALAAVVNHHLARSALPLRASPTWPLRLRLDPAPPPPGKVVAIVASTLRPDHAERCIRAVLAGTDYPAFEMVVGVAQPDPLDAAQSAAAARIEAAHPNAQVLRLDAPQFNFSWVNNRLAEATSGEFVLLLNDDVSPLAPDWLVRMVAHLADPRTGAAGAKLLYGDGSVQHGGVIMGLAGLCEHASRHLPGSEPGYAWRAELAQEFSAVTGACLLVRRDLLEALGGLDEDYPSAFNDVDLCLRIREAGRAVVLAADAVLVHHELQTYGSHYAGQREAFRQAEAARMRARWAAVCAADPFHNPNLDLEPGSEWMPAFPPRLAGRPALGKEAAAAGPARDETERAA